MKTIFVGGPIQYATESGTFNAHLKVLIEKVISDLSAAGYKVLSAHRYESYGKMDVTNMEIEVCARDYNWMNQCDAFIAVLPKDEISGSPVRSDGTCVELGWAAALGKKIVIIKSDATIYSHLVAGLGAVADVIALPAGQVATGEIAVADTINALLSQQDNFAVQG